MSGAGLACSTSSPAIVIANASPAWASVRSNRSRTLPEATATGMPRSVSSRTAATASSNGRQPCVDQREQVAVSITGQTVAASGSGARCDRYACVCAYERPTQAARSSSVTS